MLALLLAFSACSKREVERPESTSPPTAAGPPDADAAEPSLPAAEAELRRYTEDLPGDGPLGATLHTSLGELNCTLFTEHASRTVANFVGLARGKKEWIDPESGEVRTDALYADLPFHRIIPGFAIQTGDPTRTGEGGPGYVFRDEIVEELRHDRPGVMSMVSHGPNTNGSQFFVMLAAAPHLDGRHTIFGQCEQGEVLQALGDAASSSEPPILTQVVIERR